MKALEAFKKIFSIELSEIQLAGRVNIFQIGNQWDYWRESLLVELAEFLSLSFQTFNDLSQMIRIHSSHITGDN